LENEPSESPAQATQKDDSLLTKQADASAASPAAANQPRE